MIKIFFLLCAFLSCSTVTSSDLTGVWTEEDFIHPNDQVIETFSWGESYTGRNGGSIVIDDDAENPRFYISGFGSYPIVEVKTIDDTVTELVFYFILEDRNIDCIFHWINEEQYWIEDIEGISFFPTGKEWVYKKLDGPEVPISINK